MMKRHTLMTALTVAAMVSSCGGTADNRQESDYYMATVMGDSVTTSGIRKLQTIEAEVDTAFNGKAYHSHVVRQADESLPSAVTDEGVRYYDNRISLNLTSGGSKVLERDFTKATFAAYLDSAFMKHAVLEGMAFDKVVAHGLQYVASVGYPENDLYVPFNVVVSATGDVSVSKADMMDYDGTDE